MTFRLLAAALTLTVIAAGCGTESDPTASGTPTTVATEASDSTGDPTSVAGTIDPSLTRTDVDCSPEELDDDDFEFLTAHYVVDGALGAACLGEEDATLTQAWEELALITPPDQLTDLSLFGGFGSFEDSEEVTLAFVNTLGDDGEQFQMSVNLDAYDEDADQAQLTMAHEFSHVFTGLSSELDRTNLDPETCDTFSTGDGCYEADALMYVWIQEFWGDGLIQEIDPDAEPTGAEGQDRCDANPGFFGAYAASSPEEDFAESFSAHVYRVEAATDEQQAKLDWMADQPGLAEFQDRAVAAGLGPLDNSFDPCG